MVFGGMATGADGAEVRGADACVCSPIQGVYGPGVLHIGDEITTPTCRDHATQFQDNVHNTSR